MTAVERNIPLIGVIVDDSECKLIRISELATSCESALVEFQNQDFATPRQHVAAEVHTVENLDEFENAFRKGIFSWHRTVNDTDKPAGRSRATPPHPKLSSRAPSRQSRKA
jgi:thiamine pyrophosphate-dependent acetolactate synthase large subunit-like protein